MANHKLSLKSGVQLNASSPEFILKAMLAEGKKRRAPVLSLKAHLRTGFDSLVYAILSPRSSDRATLGAFLKLRKKASSFSELSSLSILDIDSLIRSIGLHNQKAKRLMEISKILKSRPIPSTLAELKSLPGVGDKVASVFLADHLGKPEIAVDIHVFRISNRLGMISAKNPLQAKSQLKKVFPKSLWGKINLAMVSFGQTVCLPRNPKCSECRFRKVCRFYSDIASSLPSHTRN